MKKFLLFKYRETAGFLNDIENSQYAIFLIVYLALIVLIKIPYSEYWYLLFYLPLFYNLIGKNEIGFMQMLYKSKWKLYAFSYIILCALFVGSILMFKTSNFLLILIPLPILIIYYFLKWNRTFGAKQLNNRASREINVFHDFYELNSELNRSSFKFMIYLMIMLLGSFSETLLFISLAFFVEWIYHIFKYNGTKERLIAEFSSGDFKDALILRLKYALYLLLAINILYLAFNSLSFLIVPFDFYYILTFVYLYSKKYVVFSPKIEKRASGSINIFIEFINILMIFPAFYTIFTKKQISSYVRN